MEALPLWKIKNWFRNIFDVLVNYGRRYPPVHCFTLIWNSDIAFYNIWLTYFILTFTLCIVRLTFVLLPSNIHDVICIWLSGISFCNLWLTSFILTFTLCIVRLPFANVPSYMRHWSFLHASVRYDFHLPFGFRFF